MAELTREELKIKIVTMAEIIKKQDEKLLEFTNKVQELLQNIENLAQITTKEIINIHHKRG